MSEYTKLKMNANVRRFLGEHAVEEMISWAKSLRYFYLFGQYFFGQVELYEQLIARIRFDRNW